MSDDSAPAVAATEHALPWGPVVRGERWGTGADRVVLLHEPGVDIDQWQGLTRTLSRLLPVEAIAYDLPGHGLSDDPWEPTQLADVIRSLVAPSPDGSRTCLVAAGSAALAALDLSDELNLTGFVGLSPSEACADIARSPRVPKLLFAGSLAGNDLEHARRHASGRGAWASVTAIPTDGRGTGLLAIPWGVRVSEEIAGFLRDCLLGRRTRAGEAVHDAARRTGER